jgi:hypothetical protein
MRASESVTIRSLLHGVRMMMMMRRRRRRRRRRRKRRINITCRLQKNYIFIPVLDAQKL